MIDRRSANHRNGPLVDKQGVIFTCLSVTHIVKHVKKCGDLMVMPEIAVSRRGGDGAQGDGSHLPA